MTEATAVTVVVPTRGDPSALTRIAQDIAPAVTGELLVILNNDSSHAGENPLPFHARVTVRTCPGGGVARARNLALSYAPTDVVIFVDDDVVLTPHALEGLRSCLSEHDAAIATGRVLPADTASPAGRLHTLYLGLDRGPRSRVFDLTDLGDVTPTTVWQLGVGAFFAVHRRRLQTVATPPVFDESLSNGRFCGGAEDSDFFYQALLSGLTVAYDAHALVTHRYPEQRATVARKMRQYARADGAFYAKHASRLNSGAAGTDLHGWGVRSWQHLRRAALGADHVPLIPQLLEPLDKTVGASWWLLTGHR